MTAGLLLAAALASPLATPARPAPTRPGLTWAAADSLARKIGVVERALAEAKGARPALPRTLEVSEGELNSYLNLTLGPKVPPELSQVAFRIEAGRLAGTGLVDLDRLKAKVPASGPLNPLSLLGGLVAVDLKARLASQDGVASFAFDEIRLAGVSLPVAILQQAVLSATRTRENPAGFDLGAPFRLPYAIKQVRLEPGRAWLSF